MPEDHQLLQLNGRRRKKTKSGAFVPREKPRSENTAAEDTYAAIAGRSEMCSRCKQNMASRCCGGLCWTCHARQEDERKAAA